MPDTYSLIVPVTIEKRTPGRDGGADKVETRTITAFPRKPIKGATYFQRGDVNFVAQSPGGASFEVELDEVIEGYLRHQIDDPDAGLIFDALTLPDALALRQDLVDLFEAAVDAARKARAGADPELVVLIDPPTIHGEVVRELKLSEPVHRTFARHGRPFTWSRTPDGAVQPMERMDVIRRYLDKSIEHELGDTILSFLALADAMQLKRAILHFFTRAAAAANGARSSTVSSSTGDSSASTQATP